MDESTPGAQRAMWSGGTAGPSPDGRERPLSTAGQGAERSTRPQIRVLLVEDSDSGAELVTGVLRKAGFDLAARRVEDAPAMREALAQPIWDLIVAGYQLSRFNAMAALQVLRESGCDIPFIVVSGTLGEDLAVETVKAGAQDYVLKDNLTRLPATVERELRETRSRAERKAAEESLLAAQRQLAAGHRLLDAIFTAQTACVVVLDEQATVIRMNPAAIADLGFDATGMSLATVCTKLGIPVALENTASMRALRGETVVNLEEPAGERTLELSSAPMRDETGRVIGAVTISRDITARRRAEEHLRQTQKLESIVALAGGVAHDFNNILTAIAGNIGLAADLCGNREARHLLTVALESVSRASGLTRQLLAYAGKGAFLHVPVSASEVAQGALRLLHGTLPKTVEVKTGLAPSLPPVLMDPSQMEQILMNLILNAIEAVGQSEAGVVTVRTSARGEWVCIEVADTGCGMAPEVKARMFEPFFSTKFTGRGLGLAAVDGIVRALHGQIAVESAPGKGTSVEVRLPATGEKG